MTSERILLDGEEQTIQVRPITLIVKSSNTPFDVQAPERLMIDARMTLAHAAQVVTLHPKTEGLFRIVFPKYDRAVTPDEIRREGVGMRHVLGLIDLSLRCVEAGRKCGWHYPESFLDPAAQPGLADVLIALAGCGGVGLSEIEPDCAGPVEDDRPRRLPD
jgi:hypothetical protein